MTFATPASFIVPVLPRIAKFLKVQFADRPLLLSPDFSRPDGIERVLSLQFWAITQSEKVLHYTDVNRRPRRNDDPNKGWRVIYPPNYTAKLSVEIDEIHHTRRHNLLSHIEISSLIEITDYFIKDDFLQFVNGFAGTIAEAIRTWTDKYDFSSEDISEVALKQWIMRDRKQTPFTVTRGSAGLSQQKAA